MLAFSEKRVPLGVLTQQVWARDADIYDLFMAQRSVGVDLLVRAAMDRNAQQIRAHSLRQS